MRRGLLKQKNIHIHERRIPWDKKKMFKELDKLKNSEILDNDTKSTSEGEQVLTFVVRNLQ